ncbi:MAG: HAD family hydrolase [Actinomycetota bacterium]
MSGVEAVVFDYGHTIVDFRRTEEALLDAYRQIRERIEAALEIEAPEVGHLIDRVAREVDRLVGVSYEERRMEELDAHRVFDEVLRAVLGLEVPRDVVGHIVALDHSAFTNTITVSEENLAVLARLKEQGHRLGLISNVTLLPDLMRADIEALGIGQHLDAALFSSEVGVRKPDERIFRAMLERLGVAPERTVFVGDRLVDDVDGAHRVGMRAVQTREFRVEEDPAIEPDAVIERLPELLAVLEPWAAR